MAAIANSNRPNEGLSPARRWAALLLGFSLGGFFDGILLHQILRWHHLLSGLEGAAFRDLQVQLLADGLFHLLMYVLALAGLWLLWRARARPLPPEGGRRLLALALIGFGVWHLLDGLLSHWLLGLHRIKMDSPNPLLWDLAWFLLFGLLPLAAGWRLGRGSGQGPRQIAPALVLAVLLAGPLAALPPDDASAALVLFPPGTTPAEALNAAAAAEARAIWGTPSGELWALDLSAGSRLALYRQGALFVTPAAFSLGCLSWSR